MSSEISTASSPTPGEQPLFSDEPAQTSSPPSSPPGFPWEQIDSSKTAAKSPPQPDKSAFSVLGKRKALSSTSDNARPAKKLNVASEHTTSKTLTQLQISLGQQVQKKCQQCGMEYVASSSEDRKLHDKYHKQNSEGYDVGKDFVQKARHYSTVSKINAFDTICMVDCYDKPARKRRAQAVLDIAQRELGAVPIPENFIWALRDCGDIINIDPTYRIHMYIRGSKCVGLLLIQRIKEAYKVLEPAELSSTRSSTMTPSQLSSALSVLKAKQQAAEAVEAQPLQLSKDPVPASIGISRIWVSPTHRRQNIAKCMLDAAYDYWRKHVREHVHAAATRTISADETSVLARLPYVGKGVVEGAKRAMDEVAFSQPTEAGTKLARHWCGTKYGWLVYVD